jgi:outer membrane protein assembly factor BamA
MMPNVLLVAMTNYLLAAILLSAIQSGDLSNGTSEPIHCGHLRVSREVFPKGMKVEHITFVGNPALPVVMQDVIAESLKATTFDDDKRGLEDVGERLHDAWQEQGYFNAKPVPKLSRTLEDSPGQRVVALTVDVEAGNQYRLGEIAFRQVTQFSAAELRSLFPIQQGDVFDTHKIQKGMEELRKGYGAKGFISFAAVPHTTINENTAVISLTIDADECQQIHIGRVNVLGVNPALTQKLLNEAGLRAGSIFDPSRLREFFEKVSLFDRALRSRYLPISLGLRYQRQTLWPKTDRRSSRLVL